jgi:hypothetical protein
MVLTGVRATLHAFGQGRTARSRVPGLRGSLRSTERRREGRKEGRRSTFGGACRRDSAWTEVEVVAVGGGRRASAAGGTTRPTDERRAPRASEELRGAAPGPHMLLLPIGPC